jgi:hypothetical protein
MTRLILLPALLIAAPAAAAPVGQAQFAPGTSLPAKIVVNDTLWSCSGTACTGPAETRAVAMQRACGTLAHAGTVTAITVGEASVSAEGLARCNAKAGNKSAEVATN